MSIMFLQQRDTRSHVARNNELMNACFKQGGRIAYNSAFITKALKVPSHLSTQRQITCIEALDLLNAGASILC